MLLLLAVARGQEAAAARAEEAQRVALPLPLLAERVATPAAMAAAARAHQAQSCLPRARGWARASRHLCRLR